ncbi:MAG: hypothetical protein V8R40_14900 [Dysosmobacter sp.]
MLQRPQRRRYSDVYTTSKVLLWIRAGRGRRCTGSLRCHKECEDAGKSGSSVIDTRFTGFDNVNVNGNLVASPKITTNGTKSGTMTRDPDARENSNWLAGTVHRDPARSSHRCDHRWSER